ncbi:hypothetical protein ACSSS7_000562 [Eimeria intestinalis]
MEEKVTGQTTSGETVGCTDSSIEDHPLFMTRVPSASDFRNNSMLAALAALIDEDEGGPQDPGPIRRQRRPPRPQPWTHAKWSTQKSRKHSSQEASAQQRAPLCPESRGALVGSSSQAEAAESSRRGREDLVGEGKPLDEADEREVSSSYGAMDCETTGPTEGSTAAARAAHTNSSPSLGELQICMRLFSMK